MTPVSSIRRTSRTVKSARGTSTERRAYDAHGRLAAITEFGKTVKFFYDAKGRIARQVVDGSPIDFAYTKYGQLAGKYLGGKLKPDAAVEYEYSPAGQIVARTANGVRQTYEYDGRGQLLAVKDADGNDVERYRYDRAGNMVRKSHLKPGRAVSTKPPTSEDYTITTFTFDGANQLVSSTTDGVTTKYAYDAAGRLVKEGDRTYRYGYLDKVLSVTDGERTYTYDYHVDGQLARADYGNGKTEGFLWDGLALVRRGDEQFINEPHVGGGNPVASSKGTSYFNDMLGTTVGAKKDGKYSAAALSAFGENLSVHSPTPTQNSNFFTGKPFVEGLGHAFLMRNYRAGLAKWQSGDPMGYPDGWNQLAYCNNGVIRVVDLWGGHTVIPEWNSANKYGVTIIQPPNSAITLGHWWSVDAECNGDPANLQITYNIVTVPGSKDQFNAPFFVVEGAYTDNKATYFDFSCKVLPVDGYPKKWNHGGVAHIEVQFNLEIKYKVRYSYQYFDENGEIQIGYATQTIVRPLENVVLECQHRIPE